MRLGDEELEDDCGTVVFLKDYLRYEDKVWAIFDDLFGGREHSLVMMKFLALTMRRDDNGRHILFLHGEAADGKAFFIKNLAASLGGTKSKLITSMNGEEFTSRNGRTLNGAFFGVSPDVRYLFVCEMPALDMGPRGVPLVKRMTGSDEVTMRAPYVKNCDCHNMAKIVATSSQLLYFKDS